MCLTVVLCALCFICADAEQSPTSSAKDQKTSGRSVIRGRVIYADTAGPLRRAEVDLVSQDSEKWTNHSVTVPTKGGHGGPPLRLLLRCY